MKILDLYCGTKSWSKPFEGKAEITSVDINHEFNPTLVRDILSWNYIQDIGVAQQVDVIFASPPCNLYFTPIKTPHGIRVFTEDDWQKSLAFVEKTIEIINFYSAFKDIYWLVENPKGKMRYVYPFIRHTMFKTVDYCMYGLPYKKPTDIWTNIPFEPKKCNHKKHEQAIRAHSWNEESYYKKTDLKRAVHRARIPEGLTSEIATKITKGEKILMFNETK